MQTRFLLGPAGSGKTHRCLHEIRSALLEAPDGPPLILIAPKQATFQLERQLLAEGGLAGYTRLQILSFDRLAQFVFEQLDEPIPELLSEDGRVMVLRALLEQKRDQLHIFRASSKLPGFAQRLSRLLRELQGHCFTLQTLRHLAERMGSEGQLSHKLADIHVLLEAYLDWLQARGLQDGDLLPELAAHALRTRLPSTNRLPCLIEGLWLDGFARLTPQERTLLLAVAPNCRTLTLAFCLDARPDRPLSWHSPWNVVGETFRQCHDAILELPDAEVEVEVLDRNSADTRFAGAPVLRHLEARWARPRPWAGEWPGAAGQPRAAALRVVSCLHPEAEAILAAREILRFARAGGRFRDVAVLVRDLNAYHDPLRRVFSRYQIPFFLDRRESVGHHPLSELTRCALRTVAHGWRSTDWFGALKSGLLTAPEGDLDWLENEALARGWEGDAWHKPLSPESENPFDAKLETLRKKLIRPFVRLRSAILPAPTGTQLAEALRAFWEDLRVPETLERWSAADEMDAAGELASPVHATVWDQMEQWLHTLALAFPGEAMPLKNWLAVLETGLGSLTVGVIPPVLDQVLIGAIDRSRNPDLRELFLLGVNETVFPALPSEPDLLTRADRERLELEGHALGMGVRAQIGQEQFYGYIACTRARERVTLTCAARDAGGSALNPSSFLSHLRRLFPGLEVESDSPAGLWWNGEHASELIVPLLCHASGSSPGLETVRELPALGSLREQMERFQAGTNGTSLEPAVAADLYGSTLRTSVSRMEQFAACPFRFFVNSGLRAEERLRFELDVRQKGSFQHDVLAAFHESVRQEGKQWRDLTPDQAGERVGEIADALAETFQSGLLRANPEHRFLAESYKLALQRFMRVVIDWFRQNQFDPAAVELGFGLKDDPLPAWEVDLGEGHALAFRGRIDRVDLWRSGDTALCVVIDYKSSERAVDRVLLEHGVQQQLPAYLNVLRRTPGVGQELGVGQLVPAGVFYVNLRGKYESGANREEVLAGRAEADKRAYRHQGLFDFVALRQLDSRADVGTGDQFAYRLKRDGQPYKNCAALQPEEFLSLLDHAEALLTDLGRRIYGGVASVDPYRKGTKTACDDCLYRSICRIDPTTHAFRLLGK